MNRRDYNSARRIKLGEKPIRKDYRELAAWIDETFKVKTLNISKYKVKPIQDGLKVILEFERDKRKFSRTVTETYINKQIQALISDKYHELVEQGIIPIKSALKHRDKSKPIWIDYYSFENMAKKEIASKLPDNIHEYIKEKLGDKNIWTVQSPYPSSTVFLYTEQQRKDYIENGYPEKWREYFLELFKPYDEFDYLKKRDIKISLYSKERFEKNDEGNWMYFYR